MGLEHAVTDGVTGSDRFKMHRAGAGILLLLLAWLASVCVAEQPWRIAEDWLAARPMPVCQRDACRVEIPGGSIAQFPEGTPVQTIRTALDRRDGGPLADEAKRLRELRAQVEMMNERRRPRAEINRFMQDSGISNTQLTNPVAYDGRLGRAMRVQGGHWVPAAFLDGVRGIEIYDGWVWRLDEGSRLPPEALAEAAAGRGRTANLQQIGEAEQARRFNEMAAETRADVRRRLWLFLALVLAPTAAGGMALRLLKRRMIA